MEAGQEGVGVVHDLLRMKTPSGRGPRRSRQQLAEGPVSTAK